MKIPIQDRIRVGFIGLNPDSHWAATAHVPALKSLADKFAIVGVANSSPESSRRTAENLVLPYAFDSVDALVNSSEIDLVVVTVKVPHHLKLVTAALEAGKHVYCEWPLGNGLAEARQLAKLAEQKGVVAVVGTQARAAVEIGWPDFAGARNIAHMYSRMFEDIGNSTRTAPTFQDAVALHELIDGIEQSAQSLL